ncbi:hypothetical protein LSTR_LSTR000321 [Laodelphax striatellus]|uniref:Peptidase S1 domain-containing protein n=1 Tax=Laodelphax striatellus TaxID=195883 RepID=A0A482X7D9_LAOST|nr:hypothetical protein LSTR_LSTR000321 [Laodelphax striatellus]
MAPMGKASPKLLKVELDGLSISDCNGTAENNPEVPRGLDDNTMVCAGILDGGKDTCSGDSGGPLFLPPRLERSPDCELRTQVGVTSFGKQCGLEGFPGVYTKVEAYVSWIESHVWPANNFDLRKLFIWSDK